MLSAPSTARRTSSLLGYMSLAERSTGGRPQRAASRSCKGLGIEYIVVHHDNLTDRLSARTRRFFEAETDSAIEVAAFGDDIVYRLAPAPRFARLREAIPRDASIYLAQEEPQETYIGMIGWVLRDNPLHARIPTEFGQRVLGPPPRATVQLRGAPSQGRSGGGRFRRCEHHLGRRDGARLPPRRAVNLARSAAILDPCAARCGEFTVQPPRMCSAPTRSPRVIQCHHPRSPPYPRTTT